jgi:hypothetical protein
MIPEPDAIRDRPRDTRINHHLRNVDRSRAYALVDGILAAGRTAGRLREA